MIVYRLLEYFRSIRSVKKYKNRICIFALFTLFSFTLIASGAERNAISLSYGKIQLGESNQTIQRAYSGTSSCFWLFGCSTDYSYEDVPLIISNENENLFGIRYERNFRIGFAGEMNVEYAKSTYMMGPTSVTGLTGEGHIQLLSISAAIKYYFNKQAMLQPYVSGGIGFVHAKFTGTVDVLLSDTVFPLSLGISNIFSQYRVFIELTDTFSPGSSKLYSNVNEVGQYRGEIDLRNKSLNIGISRMF